MKFEDMGIWKRSTRLCAEVYKYFADCPDYGFKDQITRSSLSIPSNIAEGAERNSDKDFARFLDFAQGSCGELRTQTYIGMKIEYISNKKGKEWIKETQELSAMIKSFNKTLRS